MTLDLKAAPGDPRIARSREAILDATVALLTEGGANNVTIEGVAERSGVAKTTIYRHWHSRSQLVFDAFKSLLEPDAARLLKTPLKDGSIRDTLIFLLNGLIRGLTNSPWAPTVSALVDAAERDQEMRRLIHDFLVERMAGTQVILAMAVERGELSDSVDPELAVDMLAGAVFYRRLVSRQPLGSRFAEQVVDQFLAGATARPQ